MQIPSLLPSYLFIIRIHKYQTDMLLANWYYLKYFQLHQITQQLLVINLFTPQDDIKYVKLKNNFKYAMQKQKRTALNSMCEDRRQASNAHHTSD